MAKKNIRSQIIRDLLEDKEKLNQQLRESADSIAQSFLGEAVNDSLKKLIKEDEDSYDEEEVEVEVQPETANEPKEEIGADAEIAEPEAEESSEEIENEESEEDDVWGELEQYKGEDGEYDLTGMDKDSLIKVMKVMGPEDGVRIIKNGNGTYTLSDDETEKEYIIDLEDEEAMNADIEDDAEIDAEDDEETVYELDFDVDECVTEGNLGYTDSYVEDSAMEIDSNDETADADATYSMDCGAPEGVEKPYAGKGDNAPFVEGKCKCNGAGCKECQLDEVNTTAEMGPANRGVSMYHGNNGNKAAKGRNSHEEGEQKKGTTENSYSGIEEGILRKAKKIFNENKQLKALLPKMQERLEEAVVINQSLMNMLSLVTENSTTRDEKKMMCERFNRVKTRKESNDLYKVISEEFKLAGKSNAAIDRAIKGQQLSESKTTINEAPMYQDKSLNETKAFMERLARIR